MIKANGSCMSRVELVGLKLPVVEAGADLAKLIVESAKNQGVGVLDGDIVVVTDKVVSKSLGLVIDIEDVEPSQKAVKLAKRAGLDPRFVEGAVPT